MTRPWKDILMETVAHFQSETTSAGAQMNAGVARRPALGASLIGSAVLSVVGYLILGSAFGWPDVLDEPGSTALDKYIAAETAIRLGFYAMTLSSLLLIPAAIALQAATVADHTAARVVTAFGVLGAFAQMLGWLRWVVAVPVQADLWTAAATDQQARQAVSVAYDSLNAYAGGTLGEHLGWLLQAAWAIGIFVFALRTAGIPRWLSWTGLALALGWAATVPLATATGAAGLETIGMSIYSAWYVWILVLGVAISARRVGPGSQPQSPLR